jgi:hypothetical protein
LDVLGSKIDRIGVSYYPDWHGSWVELERNLVEISKLLPGTKINISECSPRNTSWPAGSPDTTNPNHPDLVPTVQTQGDDFAEILKIVSDIPNNVGVGLWSWAGAGEGQYGPVNFTLQGTNRQPYASMKVFKDAFVEARGGIPESDVFITVKPGYLELPKKVLVYVKNGTAINPLSAEEEWEPYEADVTWDTSTVTLDNLMNEGLFDVPGTAFAGDKEFDVTAHITVTKEALSEAEGYVANALDEDDDTDTTAPVSTSSSGCDIGFGFAGLAAMAFGVSALRRRGK